MMKKNKRVIFTAMLFLLLILLSLNSCITSIFRERFIVTAPETANSIGSINIRSNHFFWLLRPWKEGTLVTIDGWGKFSELSFKGEDRISIKPLVQFPKRQMDRNFLAWPDAGLIIGQTGKMFHIADTTTGTTKSTIPFMSWNHFELDPVLLDSAEGIVYLSYYSENNHTIKYFLYNYKSDQVIFENDDKDKIYFSMEYPLNNTTTMCLSSYNESGGREFDFFLYDWKKQEIIRNEFTDAVRKLDLYSISITNGNNINMKKRIIFASVRPSPQKLKISWNEDYSDTSVIPINYLIPNRYWFCDFRFSEDGQWGESMIGGFHGLYGEYLYKRAFFHLDDRYPNGISIPVYADDYMEFATDYGSFVEHPVYGTCFAEEWRIDGQLYLKLHKMSDAMAVINRQERQQVMD
jgi:hypothetical protein